MFRLLILLFALALIAFVLTLPGAIARRRERRLRMPPKSMTPEHKLWETQWRKAALRGPIRKRVLTAHDSCARLLRLVRVQDVPPHVQEFSDAMLRRVPDSIAEHVRACEGATREETRRVQHALADLLEEWAVGAERHRLDARADVESRLDTQRRYAERRTRDGE